MDGGGGVFSKNKQRKSGGRDPARYFSSGFVPFPANQPSSSCERPLYRRSTSTMKAATCALAASVFAATTAALATTTTSAADAAFSSSAFAGRGVLSEGYQPNLNGRDCVISSSEKEKFAPRFDGLRFIETLVTAHR